MNEWFSDYNAPMFRVLGKLIAGRPIVLIGLWVALVGTMAGWEVMTGDPPPPEVGSFVPPESAYNRAVALTEKAFPKLASRSYAVIIVRRSGGLTSADRRWLARTTQMAGDATEGKVLSPSVPFLEHRLVSPDGQAAMGIVNLSGNYIGAASIEAVEKIDKIIDRDKPEGLTVEMTGPGGMGRDYLAAMERAVDHTTVVTVVAVLAILILVYRSPIGALVPLLSIGASVYIAFNILDLLANLGWMVSSLERIFSVVLLFGAGVDFALFWIARYRESLTGSEIGYAPAAETATRHAGPAILASAATTICGLSTMVAADLVPLDTAGRVLAPILVVALIAALTLAPSLARIFGRWLFWPGEARRKETLSERVVWPRLAGLVTRRPRTVLILGVVALAVPAAFAASFPPRFDSFAQLPPESSSARGFEIAQAHFPDGMLYPNNLLLEFTGESEPSTGTYRRLSEDLRKRIETLPGVFEVYSLDAPLGGERSGEGGLGQLLSTLAQSFYKSPSMPVLRFEVLINHEPFSREAMSTVEAVRDAAEDVAADVETAEDRAVNVYLAGLTSYIVSVRDVVGDDQIRVMLLATLVIAVIVALLVRDIPLTIFMLLATWLTFGMTITLTNLFFIHVIGQEGLDYKVRLIVFVIVVAVGQDYNIFLVTRMIEEDASNDPAGAKRAIVRTGSVISNCGLIMAATLGSLWAGGLMLLQQLGFALALGVLIDTFFVRSLLLPSFFLATKRRAKSVLAAAAHG